MEYKLVRHILNYCRCKLVVSVSEHVRCEWTFSMAPTGYVSLYPLLDCIICEIVHLCCPFPSYDLTHRLLATFGD